MALRDLLRAAVAPVDHQYLAAKAAEIGRRRQPGGAAADNQTIEIHGAPSARWNLSRVNSAPPLKFHRLIGVSRA